MSKDKNKESIQAVVDQGLGFAFKNAEKQTLLYATDDASKNKITFSITNNSGKALALPGGSVPTDNPPPASGPAVIYLAFSNQKITKALTFDNPDWNILELTSNGMSRWGLSPKGDVSLAPGKSIELHLGGIAPEGMETDVTFFYEWYNISGVSAGGNQMDIPIVPLPAGDGQDLNIDYGFEDSNVYINENPQNQLDNYLQFYLRNTSSTPLVPNDTPWGEHLPVFNLYFIFGLKPGYGALTEPQGSAQAINVELAENYKGLWEIKKHTQGAGVSFSLSPVLNQNHEILGTYANAAVQFKIGPIETDLAPGITSMNVSYQNIPGYKPGTFSLGIFKRKPVPGILSFFANPSVVRYKTPTSISWNTFAVSQVKLTIFTNNKETVLRSADGQISIIEPAFKKSFTADATLTLVAYDSNNIQIGNEQQTINVLLPNPEIHFSANPQIQVVKGGEQPKPVKLSWDVKFADEVNGVRLPPEISNKYFPAKGSFMIEKPKAGKITLTAVKTLGNSEKQLISKQSLFLTFSTSEKKPKKSIFLGQIDFRTLYNSIWFESSQFVMRMYPTSASDPNQDLATKYYGYDYASYAQVELYSGLPRHFATSEDGKVFFNSNTKTFYKYNSNSKKYEVSSVISDKKVSDTITEISNDEQYLFAMWSGFYLPAGKKTYSIYHWDGTTMKNKVNVDIYAKDTSNVSRKGSYYSEESGLCYVIPFHTGLYIFDKNGKYSVLELTGYNIENFNQLHVSEKHNLVIVYNSYNGSFAVFDLITGQYVKSFPRHGSTKLCFSEDVIVRTGIRAYTVEILYLAELPDTDFVTFLNTDSSHGDTVQAAFVNNDLSKLVVLTNGYNLVFYDM